MTQLLPFGGAVQPTEAKPLPLPTAVPSTQAVLARALARSHQRSTRVARWRTARRWGVYHAWRHMLPVAMAVFVPASSWWPIETQTQTATQTQSQASVAITPTQVATAAATAATTAVATPAAPAPEPPEAPSVAVAVPAQPSAPQAAPQPPAQPLSSDEPPLRLKSSGFGSAAMRATSNATEVSKLPIIASPQLLADQSLHSQEP